MKCKHCEEEFIPNRRRTKFCNKTCFLNWKRNIKELKCAECDKIVARRLSEINKSKDRNVFCSRSCGARYNNLHKKHGNRRSKLESWLETKLVKQYDFVILFNDKQIINAELDIYIPHLKLAFELNGIFHYEPIFGETKFEQIKNNDKRKFQACLENDIELCIIDSSGMKYFKEENCQKYLTIIETIIQNKNGNSNKD